MLVSLHYFWQIDEHLNNWFQCAGACVIIYRTFKVVVWYFSCCVIVNNERSKSQAIGRFSRIQALYKTWLASNTYCLIKRRTTFKSTHCIFIIHYMPVQYIVPGNEMADKTRNTEIASNASFRLLLATQK